MQISPVPEGLNVYRCTSCILCSRFGSRNGFVLCPQTSLDALKRPRLLALAHLVAASPKDLPTSSASGGVTPHLIASSASSVFSKNTATCRSSPRGQLEQQNSVDPQAFSI